MMAKLRKMMAIALAVVVLAIPSLSFADEMVPRSEQKRFDVQSRANQRFEPLKARLQEKAGQALEKKEIHRSRLTSIINEYAPVLLGEFQNFWDAHDAVHAELLVERERIAGENKEEAIAFAERVKAKVLAGEMTREEAKAEIEAFRAELKAERDSIKAEIDALKDALNVPEDVIKGLHESLKAAVASEEGDAIVAILEEMIELHPQHITFDEAKLELLKTK